MADGQQGAVAQLGERLVCNQEATGSIPVSSTNLMLGVTATTVNRFTVRESCAGAEHWVGDNSTRLGGQDSKKSKVFG